MTDAHAGTSEPSSFLVENVGLLPVGRALDVAMGNGRNAIFLARTGFSVRGVDISPEAVNTARQAAKEAGVTIEAEVGDLEGGYRITPDAYNVIICFHYLHRPLIPQMKDGIRPGGMVVYETFTIDQAQFGRPGNTDYLLKYNELLDMFQEFRCLRYHEGIYGKKALAGLIAQKP